MHIPSPAGTADDDHARPATDGPALRELRALFDFPLDDFQVTACRALEEGRGVLVAAPTGAGKTVVGEFAVHLALRSHRKAFYTTPIKALSNQKYADLVRRYGESQVGLLTGDTSVNSEAPVVVMTTEVLRNMLYAGSQTLAGLGYVVMDEVHYLADRFRGPVWEEVILHLAPDVQLVSLSATVSNAEEFGDWLEMVRGDTTVVVSEHRPVPLGQHVLARDALFPLYAGHVDPTDPGPDPPINPELRHSLERTERRSPPRRHGDPGYRGRGRGPAGRPRAARPVPRFAVVDVLAEARMLPAIYFIFSRAGCDAAVSQCLAAGVRLTTSAEAAEIRRIAEERCADVPREDLEVLGYWAWLDGLARGLAAHHAGLLPLFKETVETLFARGLVKVVFATETLALGINMPARSVVLEKLVKWDGSAHVSLTPGEYTQLTGRAGRRGIDTEGHAVVVAHPALDLEGLVGLASRRTYPLRSSFRPSYNMAVNLVAQVGRTRAREVLEMSFAQFQADRGVVGLAREAKAHAEALEGYAKAMECELGDFREYADLRRAITDLEKTRKREAGRARRAQTARTLDALRPGAVVQVTGGRRSGYGVVVAVGHSEGFDGPAPSVLGVDGRVRRLVAHELPGGVRTIGEMPLPRGFSARRHQARKDLAARLRAWLDERATPRGPRPARTPDGDDAELAALRRRLREHPCHACPEREDHARWAERWHRLEREHTALVRRIEGRTDSIARDFDRACRLLARLGYLTPDGQEVTGEGEVLRRVYAENDLLVAECLRRGVWDELDAPSLAGIVSSIVYEARRESDTPGHVPGGTRGALGRAIDETVRVWSELEDLEAQHRFESTRPVDTGIVEPVVRWAQGRGLDSVLRGGELAAGDFVRWCKQVIDLLDQLAVAAPTQRLRSTSQRAVGALRRGVVAYSSL